MIRILDKYGLYPGQPQVLFAVSAEDRQMTQNELALRMNVSKASVGKSLCRLEEAGFIKRVRDKRDSRCIRVALTKKARNMRDGARLTLNCSIQRCLNVSTQMNAI